MIAVMESDAGLVKTRMIDRVRAVLAGAGAWALDTAFPPVCLNCSDAVSTPDGLCVQCWQTLVPISDPLCPVLGVPFETDRGPGAVSLTALADPPPFDRARSAVVYTDIARGLVSRLKYHDRPEIALFCARLMVAAGASILSPEAVLVPVPLHRSRQRARRYNQSAELARLAAPLAKCGFAPDLIFRDKKTAQQVRLSASQRARNVSGAFRVDPARLAELSGRPIVLVDDVITTGATVSAAAKALKRAGAGEVSVLSFARVVFEADLSQ